VLQTIIAIEFTFSNSDNFPEKYGKSRNERIMSGFRRLILISPINGARYLLRSCQKLKLNAHCVHEKVELRYRCFCCVFQKSAFSFVTDNYFSEYYSFKFCKE